MSIKEEDFEILAGFPPPVDNRGKNSKFHLASKRITASLLRWGVETHGISPVPDECRTDKRLYQLFFMWFSANFNVVAFSTGAAGPTFFHLGLRDSLRIILVAGIISPVLPAMLAVFGPKLGTRGMVLARFSWGYYGSIVPSVLNVFALEGFLVLNCIIGGQTLASISNGRLDDSAGIIVIGIVALVLTFFGSKMMLLYGSFAWIPNVITFTTMLCVGGKHLQPSEYPIAATPSTATVVCFGALITSFNVTWSTFSPDFGVYHDRHTRSLKLFVITYLGIFTPTIITFMLGAAFAAKAPAIPAWEAGFKGGSNIGGLFGALLAPIGGFGKLLVVLIALSVPSACAPMMYSFGNSLMAVSPVFAYFPRYLYSIVSTAILIPIAIVGQKRFFGTLDNILSVAGYFSTVFSAIVLVEHFLFRHGDWSQYDSTTWNKPDELPLGLAAVFAFVLSFGLIVPSMSHTWYVGPIAEAGTGDIGMAAGFVFGALFYLVFRALERKFAS